MHEKPIPKQPDSDEGLMTVLLKEARTIAVVGISDREDRDSHRVAKYLMEHGYKIIPVNPKLPEVLGEPCYPDLKSIPEHVDVVDIFRSIDAIPGIVDEAVSIGAGSVWMQLGLTHDEAAEKARRAGLSVVMNRCMKIEHLRRKG
jgi:predicted CoA-binding protein